MADNALLDSLLTRIQAMPEAAREEVERATLEKTKHMIFVPSPGPQTEAYLSQADVLLFGGSPGGGKTALRSEERL